MKPVIAISLGAPGGIGAEVLVKALGRILREGRCRPWIFGDVTLLRGVAAQMRRRLLFEVSDRPPRYEGQAVVFPFPPVPPQAMPPWASGSAAGQVQLDYLDQAFERVRAGEAHGLCTCPIHKESIRCVRPDFTGHTEYVAQRCGGSEPTMCFYSEKLVVGLVTTHCALAAVPAALTSERVTRAIVHVGQFLRQEMRLAKPLLAVCSLNPHGGSDRFGEEEENIIVPAIEAACAQGHAAVGPLPADSLFWRAAAGEFAAVIAMYHDQGLIPLKLLDFQGAVNVTLGLPIVRTSPDHGTAMELAGQGEADERSCYNAITLAARLAANRLRKKA